MRKTVPYLAAWFAAGAVAVAVASAGVSVVGDQVTDSRQAPLSAEQVRELAPEDTAPATTTTTTSPTATTTTAPTPPTSAAGSGSSGGPSGAAVTTTTTPPPPTAPAPVTRTYNLAGGTATLQFSAAGVKVLAAVPKAGFSVDVSQAHGTGARVEFEDDEHRSRVDGWWDGSPQDEVREDG